MKIFLVFLLFINIVWSSCEPKSSNDKKKHNHLLIYKEALAAFNNGSYKIAYDTLNKITTRYPSTISISYDCVQRVPAAFGTKRSVFSKTANETIEMIQLGTNIKKYLNPNPYIVIQYKPNAASVSIANVTKTVRGEINGQLPLEDVTVSVSTKYGDNQELNFGDVPSGQIKTQSINTELSNTLRLSMDERYNIKLYSFRE